jgi:hypothetical protein
MSPAPPLPGVLASLAPVLGSYGARPPSRSAPELMNPPARVPHSGQIVEGRLCGMPDRPVRPRQAVRSRLAALALWCAVITMLLVGCGTDTAATPPLVPSVPGAVPRPGHLLVVVFENKDDEQIVGSPQAPFLTELAHQGANLTDAHGEAHPSQPNYVALLSGSTHGVTDDACPQELGGAPTLASQPTAAGLRFTGFSEGLPAPGFTGCSSPDGRYARKHNPWVDFASSPPGGNARRTDGACRGRRRSYRSLQLAAHHRGHVRPAGARRGRTHRSVDRHLAALSSGLRGPTGTDLRHRESDPMRGLWEARALTRGPHRAYINARLPSLGCAR